MGDSITCLLPEMQTIIFLKQNKTGGPGGQQTKHLAERVFKTKYFIVSEHVGPKSICFTTATVNTLRINTAKLCMANIVSGKRENHWVSGVFSVRPAHQFWPFMHSCGRGAW